MISSSALASARPARLLYAALVLVVFALTACAGSIGPSRTSVPPPRAISIASEHHDASTESFLDAAHRPVAEATDAALTMQGGMASATEGGALTTNDETGTMADAGASPPAPLGRQFRGRSEDELLEAMATRPVVRVIERFSSTTLVYHLDLGDGLEIAFKPDRTGQEGWWRHEIDAYRLARVLGIEGRVPPAVTRRIPLAAFGRWGRNAGLIASGRRHDSVVGAAIYWMPTLRNAQLHTPENVRRWTEWLDPRRSIPPEHRDLASDIATVLAFDYLQANTDRWNSGNVRVDENGRIVMRDNNGAWFLAGLEREGYIESIRRLPRGFAEALARATPEALRDELARDPGWASEGPHLTRQHFAAYEARRQRLLARIRRLVQHYGEAAVYAWP